MELLSPNKGGQQSPPLLGGKRILKHPEYAFRLYFILYKYICS